MNKRSFAWPSALRETSVYALALIFSRLIGLLMLPVSTHFVAPSEYGRLEVLMALAEICVMVFALAMPATLNRFVATVNNLDERRQLCAHILGVTLLSAVFFGLATQALAAHALPFFPGGIQESELRLVCLAICVQGPIDVGLSWLRIRSAMWPFMWLTMVRPVTQAMLATLLLYGGYGIKGVLAASAIAAVMQAVLTLACIVPETGLAWPARDRFRRLAVYGGPLILAGLAFFVLGSFDRWLLADHIGPARLALYGVAAKMAGIISFILLPLHMWWAPKRFMILAEQPGGPERVVRVVVLGFLVVVFGSLALAIVAPWLLRCLFPPAYGAATAYIPWLLIAFALQELGTLFSIGTYARTNGYLPLAINGAAAIVALLLYLLLIPRFGVEGAIAATIAAQLFRTMLVYFSSQHYVPLAYPVRLLLLLGTLALATTALINLLSPLQRLVVLVPTLLAGAAMVRHRGLLWQEALKSMPGPTDSSNSAHEQQDVQCGSHPRLY